MMKRVISGVFLLIALGALGLILAGALTSGEQLIVRFLTAIIVAALGLYVISDLRLQADDGAVATGSRTSAAGATRVSSGAAVDAPPPNSTAAFMATVTGKRSATAPPAATSGDLDLSSSPADGTGMAVASTENSRPERSSWARPANDSQQPSEPGSDDPTTVQATTGDDDKAHSRLPARHRAAVTGQHTVTGQDSVTGQHPVTGQHTVTGQDSVTGQHTVTGQDSVTGQHKALGRSGAPTSGDSVGHERPELARADERMLRAVARPVGVDIDDKHELPYAQDADEVHLWPLTPEGKALDDNNANGFETGEIEGLVAIFAKNSDEDYLSHGSDSDIDLRERPELAMATAGRVPVLDDLGTGGLAVEGAGLGGADPFGRLAPTGRLGLLDRPVNAGAAAIGGTVATPAGTGSSGGGSAEAPRRSRSTSTTLAAASYTRAPLADIVDLRSQPASAPCEIEAAIRSGEMQVIASLIEQGVLSTEGPISDRDVRTMVYVAFTSSELRKILLAGGTLDGDNSAIDLGQIEVFSQPALNARPGPSADVDPVDQPIDLR